MKNLYSIAQRIYTVMKESERSKHTREILYIYYTMPLKMYEIAAVYISWHLSDR